MKDLGIVICNFNKVDYLRNCLKSIINADFDNLTIDVIVVDNASSDGSEEMVLNDFPDVILIQTGSNLGGSGGFARGMQYVLDNKYKYLGVLDNDTIVDSNAFIQLKNYLDRNSDVGVVGSTILKMDEPDIIQEMGAEIKYNHLGFILNYNERIYDETIPEVVDCDYVPACCFMTRYETLKKIGTFDPKYFIYWDDIDWCTRVKKSGLMIHSIKSSKVWHKGGAKLVTNTFPTYYFNRNLVEFFIKNGVNIKGMAFRLASSLFSVMYYSGIKEEYNQSISMMMAFDDIFSDYRGAQWDSILPRYRTENKLYKISESKNIAILDNKSIFHLRSVVKNIINSKAKNITIFLKYLDKDMVKSYFPDIEVRTYNEFNSNDFDFSIQTISHIGSYKKHHYSKESYLLDPFGNYIIDEEDFYKVDRSVIFFKIFMKVMWPVLIIKLTRLKKKLEESETR